MALAGRANVLRLMRQSQTAAVINDMRGRCQLVIDGGYAHAGLGYSVTVPISD